MILDGKYINEEQITKIEHQGNYTEELLPELYKVSKFKYYTKVNNGSREYYTEVLAEK